MQEVYQSFSLGPLYNTHDAIIQTLDRLIGYDNRGYPELYPADIYEAALDTVNNAAIIFSPSGIHPDYYLYETNPEQAMADVGARKAGQILQPYVDRTGHPTARGTLALEPDESIEQLISNGKLSLSPCVFSSYDDEGRVIKVRFQNLLIFPEIPGGPVVPGDPGTIFLNTKPNPEHKGTTMTENIIEKPIVDPALTTQLQELAQQFSIFKKEIADTKSEAENLKVQLAAKNEELAKEKENYQQYTAKIEAEKVAAKELEFQGLIHDPLFPEGLLKAENAEEILKSEFTASPAQFTRRVLSVYAMQNTFLENAGGEQGQQFSKHKSESKWDTDEGKLLLVKLGVTREQMEG